MEMSDELTAVSSILSAFPDEYSYKYQDGKVFVKEITGKESSREWIKDLQSRTHNTWICHQSHKRLAETVVFRKMLKCKVNRQSDSVTKSDEYCACPAFVTLTISRCDPVSVGKTSLDPDYPCVIEFCLDHNHEFFKVRKPQKAKPLPNEPREKLIELFHKGYSPTVARQILKVQLFSQDLYAELSSLPALDSIRNLRFHGFMKKGLGPCKNPERYLIDLIESYNRETVKLCGQAVYGLVGGDRFVSLCTPIMFRAHERPEASELVVVESYGYKDKLPKLHMLGTTGLPGGVPLGCIITEVARQEVLEVALQQLIQIMPADSFHGKTWPTVLMVHSGLEERGAFSEVWTETILLTSQSELFETLWKWLHLQQNKIELVDRQSIYLSFKKIVHAQNEEKFDELLAAHIKRFNKYPGYIKYVASLYGKRREWADCCRPVLINSENCVETLFRILRKDIVERIKGSNKSPGSNLPQIVDFLVTQYETYMCKRLTDFAQDKFTKESIGKYMPPAVQDIDVSNILRVEEDETCFYVPCAKNKAVAYFVDARHGFCSCEKKRASRLCEHLGAVFQHYCLTDEMFAASYQSKVSAIEIATGSKSQIPSGPVVWDRESSNCDIEARQSDSSVVLVSNSPPNFKFAPADTHVEAATNLDCAFDLDSENALTISNTDSGQDMEEYVELVDRLSKSELDELRGIFERITTGTQTNPGEFVPAVRAMLENFHQFVKTESALASAVQNFGRSTVQQSPEKSENAAVTSAKGRPAVRRGVKRRASFETHDYETLGAVAVNDYNQTVV